MRPLLELQKAVIDRLTSDTNLLALIPLDLAASEEKDRHFYTYIPNEAISPYIHFDEPYISTVYVRPDRVVDVTFTLHVWHNQQMSGDYGNRVPAEIMHAIKEALRFKLDVEGYRIMKVDITTERIFDDVNADVKHGVMTYRYMLDKTLNPTPVPPITNP